MPDRHVMEWVMEYVHLGSTGLEDAVAAVDIKLDEDEIATLEAPYRPRSITGH